VARCEPVARDVQRRGSLAFVPHRDLDVVDAADRAADGVNRLIDRSRRRLLYTSPMRRSVQSIGANIIEAFGRGKGRDRAHSLEIARGDAEEPSNTWARIFERNVSARRTTGRFTIC
jgi:four helix bundle protein